jgi:hypothetical protein
VAHFCREHRDSCIIVDENFSMGGKGMRPGPTPRLLPIMVSITSALAATVASSPAVAMSCSRPTPAGHVAATPIIFFGKATRDVPANPPAAPRGDGQVAVVEFTVIRAYKGVTGKTIKVRYVNDGGGNTGWGFAHDRSVLVFAYADTVKDNEPIVAQTNYCVMIHYAARHELHAEYWDILTALK